MLAACKLNGFFPRHPVCRTLAVGRVSAIRPLAIVAVFAAMAWSSPVSVVHVWEKKELTFTSTRRWANPYTDVTVWVDIVGPGFRKRVFGFWDGDRAFRVRLLAPMAGEWKWRSGSSPTDPGLSGLHGELERLIGARKRNNRIRYDEAFFGPLPITTQSSKRMALRFLSSVIPGMRRPPIVFVGTMMTNSVR